MKTLLATLAILFLGVTVATAKSLEITVPNVRSDKGTILVMVSVAGQQPIYGKADAKEGSVVITLTDLHAETAEVSLFHDEDENFQMEMSDRGPVEGYARQQSSLHTETNQLTVKIRYPETTKESSK